MYGSAKTIGQIPVLLILRNYDHDWKLLAASTDPISTDSFLQQVPRLSGMLQNSLMRTGDLLPASVTSPLDGQFPTPATGQRFGNFTWQPSPSKNVIAEIAEFAYMNDARFVPRLRPNTVSIDKVSAGELWSSDSEWQWRIWSISLAGDVVFSQVGSFTH